MNNSFDFGKVFLAFVGIVLLLMIPLLFISGNGTAAVILIVVLGFSGAIVLVLFLQSNQQDIEEDEEEETKDKNIDGGWYSNYYMKKIYEAYNIQEEADNEDIEGEDGEYDEDERGTEENNIFKEQDSEANSPFAETIEMSKPVSIKFESFEIEELEAKIKFYKMLRTNSTIILIIATGVYVYLQKNYPSLLNNKATTLFYIIILVVFIIHFIIRLTLIFLEGKRNKA